MSQASYLQESRIVGFDKIKVEKKKKIHTYVGLKAIFNLWYLVFY